MSYELNDYSLQDYPVTRSFIGFGFDAIENTVFKMRDIIRQSAKNPRVMTLARQIVYNIPEKNDAAEVNAIYDWVRDHTRYTRDVQGVETLQSPLVALDKIEQGYLFMGDCDDLTMLTLSLLKSVGYMVKIRIAAYKSGNFSHVYGLVRIGKEWIPIEPINKNVSLGWQAPGATKILDYEV